MAMTSIERMQRTIAQDYEAHSDAYWSTSEIWDDGILDPLDTRNALAVALEAAMRRPLDGRLSGVLRL